MNLETRINMELICFELENIKNSLETSELAWKRHNDSDISKMIAMIPSEYFSVNSCW